MDLVVHKENITLFNAINMSTGATSAPVNINGFSLFAIQYNWTGYTASGEVIITEGSNDISEIPETSKVYNPFDSFIPSGTTGSRLFNYEKAGFALVRIRYTTTGASGALTSKFNGKVL